MILGDLSQNLENFLEIPKFPKGDRVWGDLKSKYHQKTSFLKRSRLELIFAKNPKTFHQELKKLRSRSKKPGFFIPVVTPLGVRPLTSGDRRSVLLIFF